MTQDDAQLRGRARDVLDAIATLERRGEPVTNARLAALLSLPRQNIRLYLLNLAARGMIEYVTAERRTAIIRLTSRGKLSTGVAHGAATPFPILGEVAAGLPTLTEEQVEGYAVALRDVLALQAGDFLLRVRGDSMIGIGIYPGDLVAIHPGNEEPQAGEIALVIVPGEGTATLKRWHRNNGTVTLFSENPAYPPMTFKAADVHVQGSFVGHIGTGRARRTPPIHG